MHGSGEHWLDDAECDAWSADAYDAELRLRECEALAKIEPVTTQRHLDGCSATFMILSNECSFQTLDIYFRGYYRSQFSFGGAQ